MLEKGKFKPEREAERLKVLLVEDEPAALEASRQYLSRSGWCVDAASNASQALQMAKQNIPDVLVCDWRLGDGGTGVDVARELQQLYPVKVIFVTAHPLDELREAAFDLDVLRYLRKPISLVILASTIEEIRKTG